MKLLYIFQLCQNRGRREASFER